jgi:hypothetical protein
MSVKHKESGIHFLPNQRLWKASSAADDKVSAFDKRLNSCLYIPFHGFQKIWKPSFLFSSEKEDKHMNENDCLEEWLNELYELDCYKKNVEPKALEEDERIIPQQKGLLFI